MHDVIGIADSPKAIDAEVVRQMQKRYELDLPLIDGAVAAVRRLAGTFRLGLASSSDRPLIDSVLSTSGLGELFEVTVSSEEVARGKPSPDVYLEATGRLGVAPDRSAAVEDSANGIRAARAAGLRVIAIPNARYAPPSDALAQADVVLTSIADLTPEVVAGRDVPAGPPTSSPPRA